MVRYLVNNLEINHDTVKHKQIANELAYGLAKEQDRKTSLLIKLNGLTAKEYCKTILIQLFVKAVSNPVEHFKSAAQDEFRFLSE